jgi:hypothetical protein
VTPQSLPPDDGFASYSLSELLIEPVDQEYLVEGVLAVGADALYVAPRKGLKTTTGEDMCISMATASPYLGHFPVKRARRVGMMSGESSRLTITKAAERIARSKGITDVRDCGVRWSFDLPKLTDQASLTRLRRFVERWQLEALVIDPAYLAMPMSPAQAGCSFVVGDYLRQSLSKLREDTGVTPVLIHHGKDCPTKRPQLSDIQWAGFADWARQWVMFSRRRPYSPHRPTEHGLYMQVGSPIGHNSAWKLEIEDSVYECRWRVQVTPDDGPKTRGDKPETDGDAVPENGKLDELILSHVPFGEEGLARSAIATKAGRNNKVAGESRERLRTQGKVRRFKGKRGDVYARVA